MPVPDLTDTSGDSVGYNVDPGWQTEQEVVVDADGGGLLTGTAYYIRRASATTFSLHSTAAGATANTGRIDLTDQIYASIDEVAGGQVAGEYTGGLAGFPRVPSASGPRQRRAMARQGGSRWWIGNGLGFAATLGKLIVKIVSGAPLTAGSGGLDVSLTSGRIIVGNASNLGRGVALAGDATIVAAGTLTIANDAATYAKMQNVSAASRLLGRGSAAGAGDPEEITLGSGLTMSGTELAASGALPVADTTAVVKGSADATKLLRFEVDGFTTGTTRVMTPPDYDGTLATLAGTETFTNKTLTAPKFVDAGYVADANGNELIIFQTIASAVNQIDVSNAATGTGPIIEATGETNVDLHLRSKGTGEVKINSTGGNIVVGGGATASLLKILEPSGSGTNYSSFQAGAQAANIEYTLPAAAPAANGYVLSATTAGGMSWAVALDITGLTAADPALADEVPIYDASASANRKVTVQEVGGFTAIGVSELRLTLTTGVPVLTSDVTAAGTIYLTPYVGNRIRIYDGTRWNEYQTAELSLALTLTSGSNYDVFVYDNAGTLTLETLVWTNDTTRATALATQDGVYVKSGAATRLYLGTIRASGTNTTEFSFGGDGVEAKMYVWNQYNRVLTSAFVTYSENSWTYNSVTWRSANANAALRHSFVRGLNLDRMYSWYSATSDCASGEAAAWGVALDVTNTNHGALVSIYQTTGAGVVRNSGPSPWTGAPGIGYHYLQAVEQAAIGTVDFFGDGGGSIAGGDRYFAFQSFGWF